MNEILLFIKDNSKLVLRLMISLLVIWISFGFFPIINIESDSALLSASCEHLYYNGFEMPPDFSYQWDMQPAIYFVILLFKNIFPMFSSEEIYSVLTILFFFIFVISSSIFLERLLNTKWELICFLLLLFPEAYSISYYPNTAIFSMPGIPIFFRR